VLHRNSKFKIFAFMFTELFLAIFMMEMFYTVVSSLYVASALSERYMLVV